MTVSTCPRCERTSFEIKEVAPTGSSFKMNFVQCKSCGTPVGVVDFHNTYAIIQKQAARFSAIEEHLLEMEKTVKAIARRLAG